jgi:hypothetical protein
LTTADRIATSKRPPRKVPFVGFLVALCVVARPSVRIYGSPIEQRKARNAAARFDRRGRVESPAVRNLIHINLRGYHQVIHVERQPFKIGARTQALL